MLSGVHHVSINVADTAAALPFYLDVLGLEQIDRPELGIGGAWLRSAGQEIHLIELPGTTPAAGQHFAFRVTDVDLVVGELRAKGVEVRGPNPLPNGTRQAFCHDLDGNMIEFTQPAA